ncbi:hypothetical protein L596_029894 [Steinernema carpocapsae]|uniref:Uncharacterized protein n=1 Tax=Steinernema carpocapsae TaxID=34508 RepID=A0A4U5LR59_STECR|nr:hypothetical protein L596_029894 [Steinernema carpocapsae]
MWVCVWATCALWEGPENEFSFSDDSRTTKGTTTGDRIGRRQRLPADYLNPPVFLAPSEPPPFWNTFGIWNEGQGHERKTFRFFKAIKAQNGEDVRRSSLFCHGSSPISRRQMGIDRRRGGRRHNSLGVCDHFGPWRPERRHRLIDSYCPATEIRSKPFFYSSTSCPLLGVDGRAGDRQERVA